MNGFELDSEMTNEQFPSLSRSKNFSFNSRLREGGTPNGSGSVTTSGKYKQYPCPNCKYVTDRKNNLKRHLMTMHERCSKLLECCDAIFPNKSELRQHVTERHAGAGYGCLVCGRRFSRKALMKRHSAVHSGHREHSCELCDYATSHKSNLDRHIRRHQQRHLPRTELQSMTSHDDVITKHQIVSPGLFGSSRTEIPCREFALDNIFGYRAAAMPLLRDYSLLRERAMLKLFGSPNFAVGWSGLVGELASRHHDYPYGWEDVVSMETKNDDSYGKFIHHSSIGSSISKEWPLNLKKVKDYEEDIREETSETDPNDISPDRNKADMTSPTDQSCDLEDPEYPTSSPVSSKALVLVDPGRRTRLAPFLHTCSECSLTFASQLDLKDHVEASHPADLTRSHLKSITLLVKHAQRATVSGLDLTRNRP